MGASEEVPGPVELAVAADLAGLGELSGGVRRTLAQVALVLARGCDDPTLKTSERVAAARELRACLDALVGRDDGGPDAFARLLGVLPGPALPAVVGHAAGSGPGDVRAGGGGGGGVAGSAVDAAIASAVWNRQNPTLELSYGAMLRYVLNATRPDRQQTPGERNGFLADLDNILAVVVELRQRLAAIESGAVTVPAEHMEEAAAAALGRTRLTVDPPPPDDPA